MIKNILFYFRKIKKRLNCFSSLFIILTLSLTTIPAIPKVYFLEANYYQDSSKEKSLTIGKGEIISSDRPILKIAVSDPSIIDLQVLNEKQMFVRAKQLGSTTFLVWEKTKLSPTRFDISVYPNIDGLRKQLIALDKNIIVEYIPPSSTLGSEGGSDEAGDAAGAGGAGTSAQPSTPGGAASAGGQISQGRIILKGEVANAEIIAKAIQIAGIYVGDQGIRVISQPGGQIINSLAGSVDLHTNSGGGGGATAAGAATAFGGRDPLSFVSNRNANLSRGAIITTANGLVLSFLTVKDPPQISVAIRFYEISRTLSRGLGFNGSIGGSTLQGGSFVGGSSLSQVLGQISSPANLDGLGSSLAQTFGSGITGAIFNPDNGIGAVIQALQERGEVKTLAEPNLVIANGEPATFLAGGEVPIVRSVFTAGGASQDVTYEPFGIKFTILPVVTGKNKIFLQLSPEIRDIDTELSTFISGSSTNVRPPAFKTRRTQTQVELESGQAFAISGLLREDNTRSLRKVPGVGDIPILGTLFRSKSFKKGDSELLIVVSPQIVRPSNANQVAELSKDETNIPYEEFNQLPPLMLRPHLDLYKKDEKGPDFKKPFNPAKHNLIPKEELKLNLNDNIKDITKDETNFKKPSQIKGKTIHPPLKTKANPINKPIETLPVPVEVKEKIKTNENKLAYKTSKRINKFKSFLKRSKEKEAKAMTAETPKIKTSNDITSKKSNPVIKSKSAEEVLKITRVEKSKKFKKIDELFKPIKAEKPLIAKKIKTNS